VAGLDSRVVGTASVEGFGELGHLRSVAVDQEFRGGGLGILLVARAAAVARDRGCTQLYAVTEDAASFFERLGFRPIGPKDALPEPIARTPMVRGQCSEDAVALQLALA